MVGLRGNNIPTAVQEKLTLETVLKSFPFAEFIFSLSINYNIKPLESLEMMFSMKSDH